jgi:transglutaminase-like putative cysteine protease
VNLLLAAPAYAYLGDDAAIDHEHPLIQSLASELLHTGGGSDEGYAQVAFEYVRDEIRHSQDAGDRVVTWRASDVLERETGLCYAKSHAYVALLRAAGIPAGLCYQRLASSAGGYVLHGVTAVCLDGTWIRQDPRGNRPGVTTEFSPAGEWLAYSIRPEAGEIDYPTVYASPHPAVLSVLQRWHDCRALCEGHLPSEL